MSDYWAERTPVKPHDPQVVAFVLWFAKDSPSACRTILREFHHAEGHRQAQIESILRLLDIRGIAVSDEIRSRITDCRDFDQLALWFDRAVGADSIEDLFR